MSSGREMLGRSPHPGPLPWGEGETVPALVVKPATGLEATALAYLETRWLFLLPEREGQDEGEAVIVPVVL